MTNINFLSLGGLDEKGSNLYTLEIDSKMFILDSGYSIPDNSGLGEQYIIPDVSYLDLNRDKIKGFFISHGHTQQFGALVHFYKKFSNSPVYCSEVTANIIKIYFKKEGQKEPKFIIVDESSVIDFGGGIKAEFMFLSHSIPGNLSFIFKTKEGNVIYMTDYIFEQTQGYQGMNTERLIQLSKEKNLLVMTDATNAFVEHAVSPYNNINKFLEEYKDGTSYSRLILGLYNDNINNVIEAIKLADSAKKNVYLHGDEARSILKYLIDSKQVSNIKLPEDLNESNSKDDQAWIIFSESQDMLHNLISDAAFGTVNGLTLRDTDTLMIPEKVFDGTEKVAARVMDQVSKIGLKVITSSSERGLNGRPKLLMHPSQEDTKIFLNFLKPKYVIPVKGYYKEFVELKNFIVNYTDVKNVIIATNGQQINFKDGKLTEETRLIKNVGHVKVQTLGNKEIHNELINERKKLASDGIVVIWLLLDKDTNEISSKIDLQLRGVIFIRNYPDLIETIESTFRDIVNKNIKSKSKGRIKSEATSSISKLIRTETKKIPLV
ncbi:MAG: ribonuclease J, partial [Mycoplasmataceae bacterium]|nr:ribonuclease J [Mycoplasmataceae bacterium]